MPDASPTFRSLVEECIRLDASDLHLSADSPPHVRIHGKLQALAGDTLPAAEVEAMARSLMHARQATVFDEQQTLDLAYSSRTGRRFRINVFRERGRVALAVRRLDDEFRTFEQLRLPAALSRLADLRDGLVLVTGPAGSGKTTTLATLIHRINATRSSHIITIEDPLEYVHQSRQSLVRQRELYTDVPSFAEAVRAALREDPDVILVGEMRDLDTMRAAITAAETGHLVFSTLHTGDAVGAVDRMVGMFPGAEQESIRHQLSMVLRTVVAQRLVKRSDGDGRVPAVEILHVSRAVAHLIRTGRPQQIYSAMETGTDGGMRTMEQSLAGLICDNLIEVTDAIALARDSNILNAHLGRAGYAPASGVERKNDARIA